jgi:hypothetical protein
MILSERNSPRRRGTNLPSCVALPELESLLFFSTLFRASDMRSEMCLLFEARSVTRMNYNTYTFPRRGLAGKLPLNSTLSKTLVKWRRIAAERSSMAAIGSRLTTSQSELHARALLGKASSKPIASNYACHFGLSTSSKTARARSPVILLTTSLRLSMRTMNSLEGLHDGHLIKVL